MLFVEQGLSSLGSYTCVCPYGSSKHCPCVGNTTVASRYLASQINMYHMSSKWSVQYYWNILLLHILIRVKVEKARSIAYLTLVSSSPDPNRLLVHKFPKYYTGRSFANHMNAELRSHTAEGVTIFVLRNTSRAAPLRRWVAEDCEMPADSEKQPTPGLSCSCCTTGVRLLLFACLSFLQ